MAKILPVLLLVCSIQFSAWGLTSPWFRISTETGITSNLFGDILSDESAGLVGGLGLAPSANIGTDYALFEPVHGSAPRLAGNGIANPMAAVLASKMMLDYLGEKSWAERIENSIIKVLKKGKVLTPDLGGFSSTTQVTDAIIDAL